MMHSVHSQWICCVAATLVVAAIASSAPVIHEIHYHPGNATDVGTVPIEFIEIFNPDAAAINLSGWKLADAVTYTFPAGTTLAAGGYVVVSKDPQLLLANTGVNSFGPWQGKLSNSGETLELRDASNILQDTVSYKPGFPWPTAADGAGPSMELVHPSLDNDLGGSWRSSVPFGNPPVSYIAASATGWKFRRGTAEASSPVNAWRNRTYNDSSWTTAKAPFAYGGDYSFSTAINSNNAMRNVHRSVYYRKTFTLPAELPTQLVLKVRYDDGFVAWINGVEVKRSSNAPAGQVPYSVATYSLAGHPASAWESYTINTVVGGSNLLVAGSNVLAVHSLNESLNSSDYYFDAELTSVASNIRPDPTPGAANSARATQTAIPPQIRQVNHQPTQPTANQPVTITARITDPDGVGSATLLYQAVDPGNYIRLNDSLYQTQWTAVTMVDNGSQGDAVAGDGTYTAVLPANLQSHRRLVRYRIRCADSRGNSLTVPYSDDEQPNFAYFVYNGVPAWTGAFRPTSHESRPATSAVTYPAATVASLAPYQLIANAADVTNSQYNGSFNEVRFRGTMVYDGVVYDHIEFKNRGIGSTYVSGKNKWNFFFNRSRDLVARDNWGKKYAETWNNLILNSDASPWVPANRGAAGIEEATATRVLELAGNTAFRTHNVHLRVIDEAAEASPTDQFTGDLWGLYLALEPTEGNLLDERGLDDGNIYSIEGDSGDKKHQGDGQPTNTSDWDTFRSSLRQSGQTEAWYRANMDLGKLYTFLAINRLIGNVDVRPGDNYRYFHRSSDNRWEIIGYDFDMGFIPAHHWGGNLDGVVVAGQPDSILAIMRHPALAREYRNRCRELLDLLASDASASGGQLAQLLNEYAAMVSPPGESQTWANLDAALWNLHPRTASNHKGKFFLADMTDSRGGLDGTVTTGSWRRTLANPDRYGVSNFAARTQWFVDFVTNTYPANAAPWVRKATYSAGGGNDPDLNRQKGYGYKYLEWESLYGGYADSRNEPDFAPHSDFPARPVVTATGDPDFPTDDLTFTTSPFADPQGAATFAAWQWRIAEIAPPQMNGLVPLAPGVYEIETLASSGELTTVPGAFTIPAGVARAGKTYRVRTRQKDLTGNWSHWSAPLQFVASAPAVSLIHYWNFNDSTALITPTQSLGGGAIQITGTYESSTGQNFNAANARSGEVAGSHLRVNDPLNATIALAVPTSGFTKIRVRYETRRSGQGAGTQAVAYTLDGNHYLPFSQLTIADGTPEVKLLDFRAVAGAENNPRFGLRITFQQGAGGTAGNNRFDNLTVEGEALPPGFERWQIDNFPDPAELANPAISGPAGNPAGDGIPNLLRYALGVGARDEVASRLPRLAASPTQRGFRFPFDAEKSDLIWRVEASPDLSDWSETLFDSRTDPLPLAEDGWLTVPLPTTGPVSFARLKVERVPPASE
jgi:hypothetical protein